MSRYIERAENTARLADVNIELLLEMGLGPDEDLHAHWNTYLESLGDHHLFREHYDTFDTRSVAEFFTFSRANPSSVLSCVYAARENARMIRDQISSEMWEIINRLYLFLKQQDPERVLGGRRSDFYQQIGEMSHLFRGITDATFPRQTGYEFIQAGCYLERADKTGRILDTKHHLLEGNEHDDGSTEDAVHWVSVLRTCSALEAYHRVHVGDVLPVQVATFLIMSREFPRSVLFSLNQLQLALHAISGCSITLYSNEAERLCGQIISKLVYTSMSDILREGLHAYLGGIEDSLNRIAIEMSKHYMFSPIVDPAEDVTQSQSMTSSPVASPWMSAG